MTENENRSSEMSDSLLIISYSIILAVANKLSFTPPPSFSPSLPSSILYLEPSPFFNIQVYNTSQCPGE